MTVAPPEPPDLGDVVGVAGDGAAQLDGGTAGEEPRARPAARLVRAEERREIADGSLDVLRRGLVLALHDDQRLRGCRPCRALRALPPAPAAGADDLVLVDEDDLAGLRVSHLGRAQVGERLVAVREAHRDRPRDAGSVEDGDRHRVADGDEVSEVDERADGRDVAVLVEPAQERLRRVAVLGRLRPERRERAAPGDDRGQVRERGRAQPLGCGSLLGAVLLEQLGRARAVGEPRRVDEARPDPWITLGDVAVVREHARDATSAPISP